MQLFRGFGLVLPNRRTCVGLIRSDQLTANWSVVTQIGNYNDRMAAFLVQPTGISTQRNILLTMHGMLRNATRRHPGNDRRTITMETVTREIRFE